MSRDHLPPSAAETTNCVLPCRQFLPLLTTPVNICTARRCPLPTGRHGTRAIRKPGFRHGTQPTGFARQCPCPDVRGDSSSNFATNTTGCAEDSTANPRSPPSPLRRRTPANTTGRREEGVTSGEGGGEPATLTRRSWTGEPLDSA